MNPRTQMRLKTKAGGRSSYRRQFFLVTLHCVVVYTDSTQPTESFILQAAASRTQPINLGDRAMAEEAIEKESFWKGIAAGFLAGVAVTAALRYSPLEKLLTGLSTVEGKLDATPAQLSSAPPLSAMGSQPSANERPDHIDLAQALKQHPRSFDMGSAG